MRKSEQEPVRRTYDAMQILDRMAGKSPKMQALMEKARINAAVAQLIFDAREAAGLTQMDLAELVGTRQPVIARLEDASYEGHSLTMLHRIATALNKRLEISFAPLPESKAA